MSTMLTRPRAIDTLRNKAVKSHEPTRVGDNVSTATASTHPDETIVRTRTPRLSTATPTFAVGRVVVSACAAFPMDSLASPLAVRQWHNRQYIEGSTQPGEVSDV